MHSLISNNFLGSSRSHVGVIIINSNALQSLIYTSLMFLYTCKQYQESFLVLFVHGL